MFYSEELQARLAADKGVLSEGLSPEHSTPFEGLLPTLGDLRWVFHAIVEVLGTYELFRVCAEGVEVCYQCRLTLYYRQTVGSWSRSSMNAWVKCFMVQLLLVSCICEQPVKTFGATFEWLPASLSRFLLKMR